MDRMTVMHPGVSISEAVVCRTDLTPSAKLVYGAIVQSLDTASVPMLAKRVGIGVRTAHRAIASLSDVGLLDWEGKRGRQMRNRYVLIEPAPAGGA